MKKIVVVSDSHGNTSILKKIANIHNDADIFLHAGDVEDLEINVNPFCCVKGNNDYYIDIENRIINVNGVKIFLTHGHRYLLNIESIVSTAKRNDCIIFVHGHTHMPRYEVVDGIHVLNPGALSYPRTPLGETYAIILIDGSKNIKIEIKQL